MNGRDMTVSRTRPGMRGWPLPLLCGTMLGGLPAAACAQDAAPPQPAPLAAAPRCRAPQRDVIRTIAVAGAQRLEPETIAQLHPAARRARPIPRPPPTRRSRTSTRPSCSPTSSIAQQQRRRGDHRGRKTRSSTASCSRATSGIKDDKIVPEIKLAPRQIFTRSKVRADVARIIELYKRQGRFAATVEPKMVAARPEPRRRRVRDQRRAQVQGPPDQHHRQRGVLRRRAARRDGHQAGAA